MCTACSTFDPEEADFFYVPIYVTTMMWPVLGWADFPFFHAPQAYPRPMHAANMVLDAKRWVQQHMPWWDRRQGRDHIFLMAHDEGEWERGGGAGLGAAAHALVGPAAGPGPHLPHGP